MTSHYFDETPSTELKLKDIDVEIDGAKVRLQTAGGVFSPDHIDGGTAVLLAHLDLAPKGGDILDLGCGWGPIALSLASHSPRATIWAVDVNERSLELTRANVQRMGLTNVKVVKPEEVPADVTFSGVWSNPPIRVGKGVLHELMDTWLPRLEPQASAYLVVQKNLGADSLQRWIDERFDLNVDRIDTAKGFRVIRVVKP
jgi:16S rRNA (guanine1207-N2)-methyltransferase